jgi:hypothetical protein
MGSPEESVSEGAFVMSNETPLLIEVIHAELEVSGARWLLGSTVSHSQSAQVMPTWEADTRHNSKDRTFRLR